MARDKLVSLLQSGQDLGKRQTNFFFCTIDVCGHCSLMMQDTHLPRESYFTMQKDSLALQLKKEN